MKITLDDGVLLVHLARRAAENYIMNGATINRPTSLRPDLLEKAGVFVTLNRLQGSGKVLRGCIGFPTPVRPLVDATIEAAISAASEDPRFDPVSPAEFDSIIFEVSVLTAPEEFSVSSLLDLPTNIVVGRDGLIVKWAFGSGLLLPQVAVEYGWDAEEFLMHACRKAGAPPDAWVLPETKVLRFQAHVFEELQPRGRVVERKLA